MRARVRVSPLIGGVLLVSLSLCGLASARAVPHKIERVEMDIDGLRAEAYALCQQPYVKQDPPPVPVLDPPLHALTRETGMVYTEELAIRTKNVLESNGFYLSARPRAALSKYSMELFVGGGGSYSHLGWEDIHPDFTSSAIKPKIRLRDIPAAGRVIAKLIFGHRSRKGDYPQLFELQANSYLRFAGYSRAPGATLRLGAHNIFGLDNGFEMSEREDFPTVRAVYASVRDRDVAEAYVIVEDRAFCGALKLELNQADDASVVVDGSWYARDDFWWQDDPHTALAAYSSMAWHMPDPTDPYRNFQAHDSDTLYVTDEQNSTARYALNPPPVGEIRVRDFLSGANAYAPKSWTLTNDDRDPRHYAHFAPFLKASNYNLRSGYEVTILESNVRTSVSLYERFSVSEYFDNIVAASTIRQDIRKSQSVDEYVHFKYRTTSIMRSPAQID